MSTPNFSEKPMRVGIISNTYFPDRNGESVAVAALEKALIAKGIEVYLAVPGVAGVTYPEHILPMRAVPVLKTVSPDLHLPYGYIKDAIAFFKEKEVDIIHTHNTLMGGMEGAYIALKLGIPCVHTYHTDIESYNYWDIVPTSRIQGRNIIKIVLNSHDHVIALSSKMQKYLLLLGIQTPITRSHNVPLLDNIQPQPVADLELAAKLNISPTDIVVLTHGRVAEEKGIEVGIDVMAEVMLRNPHVKYLIAGIGVQKYIDELKVDIEQRGLTGRFIFSGPFAASDLGSLASVSHIYLNTSTTENHPTTPLEAMHLGLASVFINDLAFDYIAEDGVNSFVGKKQDLPSLISLLVQNETLRKTMANAAKNSAKEYCSHDYAQDHITIYKAVIERFWEQQDKIAETKLKNKKELIELFTKPFKQVGDLLDL